MDIKTVMQTKASPSSALIRLMVGLIFVSEGMQKFLFDEVGANRFAKIGFPRPELLAHFVGASEVIFGACILLGFFTRLAAFPLLFIMLTAIISTKIPIFLDKGFWAMAHESRTDFAMLTCLLFLIMEGGGFKSCDLKLAHKFSSE